MRVYEDVCETTKIKQWYILTFGIRTFCVFSVTILILIRLDVFLLSALFRNMFRPNWLSSSVQGAFKESTLLSFCWIRCY
jgi:hypothetical protein